MGVEELKVISEALDSLGGEARGAFMAWLGLCGLRSLVLLLIVVCLTLGCVHIGKNITSHVTLGGELAREYEVAAGRTLHRYYDGTIYGEDLVRVREALRSGASNGKT